MLEPYQQVDIMISEKQELPKIPYIVIVYSVMIQYKHKHTLTEIYVVPLWIKEQFSNFVQDS